MTTWDKQKAINVKRTVISLTRNKNSETVIQKRFSLLDYYLFLCDFRRFPTRCWENWVDWDSGKEIQKWPSSSPPASLELWRFLATGHPLLQMLHRQRDSVTWLLATGSLDPYLGLFLAKIKSKQDILLMMWRWMTDVSFKVLSSKQDWLRTLTLDFPLDWSGYIPHDMICSTSQ